MDCRVELSLYLTYRHSHHLCNTHPFLLIPAGQRHPQISNKNINNSGFTLKKL